MALVNHVQSDKKAFPAGLAYLGFYSATFRTDAELRSKWVLRGGPAMVASTSPMYGEKASYYSVVASLGVHRQADGKEEHSFSLPCSSANL